jgi:hypothetical protein
VRKRRRAAQGSSLAREILSYLSEHPQAQDSLEGVMQWWLLEREIRRWTVQVRSALAELVAEGLVLERTVESGRTLYRINSQKLNEVRSFLGPARPGVRERKGSGHIESVTPDDHSRRPRRREANDEMSTRITNKSRQALVVPLNSGTAIHLAPGETCDPVDEVETSANAKIEKMSGSGLIALTQVEDADSRGSEAGAHAPRKRQRA